MKVININGKPLRLVYGMHTLEQLAGLDVAKLKDPIYFTSRLIYFLHENHCMGHDVDPAITPGEVFDYIADMEENDRAVEDLIAVVKKWEDSQPAKALVEANNQLDKKKAEEQLLGMKSSDTPSE